MTDTAPLTYRELSNRISGCRTQLKRQGADGPRRAELERYLERLLNQRADLPLETRLAELEARLAPAIDSVYRYLREAAPTRATSDRRVRREHNAATPSWRREIGAGDYVDTSSWKPIRTRTGDQAREHDRQRAEELIYQRASKSDHPTLRAVVDAIDEADAIRAQLLQRAEERAGFLA